MTRRNYHNLFSPFPLIAQPFECLTREYILWFPFRVIHVGNGKLGGPDKPAPIFTVHRAPLGCARMVINQDLRPSFVHRLAGISVKFIQITNGSNLIGFLTFGCRSSFARTMMKRISSLQRVNFVNSLRYLPHKKKLRANLCGEMSRLLRNYRQLISMSSTVRIPFFRGSFVH